MITFFIYNCLFFITFLWFYPTLLTSGVNYEKRIFVKADHNDSLLPSKEPFKNCFKIPEKFYIDPINQRNNIREAFPYAVGKRTQAQNRGNTGIYAWVNKINNKIYIGSGDPLYYRVSDYYQTWDLISRSNLYIVRAFNKYTMTNFSLYILEYTDSDNLLVYEQKWIDLINPQYIINPKAGTVKVISILNKLKKNASLRNLALGRTHTEEVKRLMSENRKKENNPFFGKKHSPEAIEKFQKVAYNRKYLPVTGLDVEITDLDTKVTTVYTSIRKAAIYIN
jgi:group I intron endonuclease